MTLLGSCTINYLPNMFHVPRTETPSLSRCDAPTRNWLLFLFRTKRLAPGDQTQDEGTISAISQLQLRDKPGRSGTRCPQKPCLAGSQVLLMVI